MSYVNRFLVEEESQFECDGVFEFDAIVSVLRDIIMNKESKLHVVISADFFPIISYQIIELKNLINDLKPKNLMITHIVSERLECVQKEEYEKFYEENGTIQYDPNDIFHYIVRQSIGNAIEDFFQYVKMNRIAYLRNPYYDLLSFFPGKTS